MTKTITMPIWLFWLVCILGGSLGPIARDLFKGAPAQDGASFCYKLQSEKVAGCIIDYVKRHPPAPIKDYLRVEGEER